MDNLFEVMAASFAENELSPLTPKRRCGRLQSLITASNDLKDFKEAYKYCDLVSLRSAEEEFGGQNMPFHQRSSMTRWLVRLNFPVPRSDTLRLSHGAIKHRHHGTDEQKNIWPRKMILAVNGRVRCV
jgi:hypothetical protein